MRTTHKLSAISAGALLSLCLLAPAVRAEAVANLHRQSKSPAQRAGRT